MLYNGNQVAVIAWQDKMPIYFITSQFIDAPVQQVLRYDAREGRRLPNNCPKAVKAYNTYMGGTDKNDQMCRLQKCRRHYKWSRRLMIKIFIWATYNAYILMGFSKPHSQ